MHSMFLCCAGVLIDWRKDDFDVDFGFDAAICLAIRHGCCCHCCCSLFLSLTSVVSLVLVGVMNFHIVIIIGARVFMLLLPGLLLMV